MPPSLLVIQPDPIVPLARFGDWLTDEGVELRVVRLFASDPVPTDVLEDGLLVLGGTMSSLDDAGHPWLEQVRSLIRRAADRGVPTLGICLGGQLMAQAFGGVVEPAADGIENGVVEIDWSVAAVEDPLVGGLPDPFRTGEMHHDTITRLPPGAVGLGSTDRTAHQAFRVGECAWGVQFHPELTTSVYRGWIEAEDGGDDEIAELTVGLDDFARREAELHADNALIARRFAQTLRR